MVGKVQEEIEEERANGGGSGRGGGRGKGRALGGGVGVLPEVQAVGLDNLEEYLRRKLAGHD